ncbi:MAG: Gfo/Idh/MocA family oxidoreductase [Patescibacteria group bacterium]|nr:Gfo/Idh/MocA family oxidoreductase [Patescibacteria group bacterium]
MSESIRIIVIGGTGKWCEENYYPAILSVLREGIDVKVVAIIDKINPNTPPKGEVRTNLNEVLKLFKPIYLNPPNYERELIFQMLNDLKARTGANLVIVSTNPSVHYLYCSWAVENHVNVFCDKPLIAEVNCSSNVSSAKKIRIEYEDLLIKYKKAVSSNPKYIFMTPLRRRALTPYLKTAQSLQEIYDKTKEGIRYMHVILNGGIHKYPQEIAKGGAHGYLEGIGTLSHTSYHFIDLIAWYISCAPGDIEFIKINMPYVLRISDYLAAKSYRTLRNLVEGNKKFNDKLFIPRSILAAEIDFHFLLTFFDKKGRKVGCCNFIVDYSAYAPRMNLYDPQIIEYAHAKNGGRMSASYMDIHQGALQNIQIIKNDVVSEGHNIKVLTRVHPLLGQKFSEENYHNAYDEHTVNTVQITSDALRKIVGRNQNLAIYTTSLDKQYLTFLLYSSFYELIAEEYETKSCLNYKQIILSKIKRFID